MAVELAIIGLVLSGAAVGISGLSAWFARRQLRLAERLREREFEATVVVELAAVRPAPDTITYDLRVTNAGPAVARDVDVALTEWTDDTWFGRVIDRADVAPALLRGEQRRASLVLPRAERRVSTTSRRRSRSPRTITTTTASGTSVWRSCSRTRSC